MDGKYVQNPRQAGSLMVEIWSDVMCPFCYIGKRRFEQALEGFAHRSEVEVAWKSFQLDPGIRPMPGRSIYEYLSERKGWPVEEARRLNGQVARTARTLGLEFDFDRAVVANSFDAHRLIQFAKSRGRGDGMEETLFRAHFTEGRDIADRETLAALAASAGLDEAEARAALAGDAWSAEVRRDLVEARQIGVTGVPFFVLDRKYAVSGAQESAVFLKVLEEVWRERNQPTA